MLFSIIAPKGGTGCSTASALFGLSSAKNKQTLLVDAAGGDLHGIVNPDTVPKFSFLQWCISPNPDTFSLEKIAHTINEHLFFVSCEFDANHEKDPITLDILQSVSALTYEKRTSIVDSLLRYNGNCIVDLGQRKDLLAKTIVQASDVVVMTIKQCFLSLNAATRHPFIENVDAILVLKEQGRSIASDQIMQTLSKDVLIEIQARRDWAKTIDAGVLAHRTPTKMIEPIESFIKDNELDAKQENEHHSDVFDALESENEKYFWSRDQETSSKGMNPFADAKRVFLNARNS